MNILTAIPSGSVLNEIDVAAGFSCEDYQKYIQQLENSLTLPQREVYDATERFKL